MMKIIASSLSVLFGIIASVLVFTPYFKTPPMPILIFAILGMIVGFYSLKEIKGISLLGIVLSIASLTYLALLFIGLGS